MFLLMVTAFTALFTFVREKSLFFLPTGYDSRRFLAEHLINRFGGRISLFPPLPKLMPTVHMQLQEQDIVLREGPLLAHSEHMFTTLAMKLPSAPMDATFVISGRMNTSEFFQGTTATPLAPCEVEFDSRFKILTSGVGPVATFLDSKIGVKLLQKLYEFGQAHDISVVLQQQLLEISTPFQSKTGQQLEGFLRLALSLAAEFKRAIEGKKAAPFDGSLALFSTNKKSTNDTCVHCGGEIISDEVLCTLCFAPHHLECWEKEEHCSTFGCFTAQHSQDD